MFDRVLGEREMREHILAVTKQEAGDPSDAFHALSVAFSKSTSEEFAWFIRAFLRDLGEEPTEAGLIAAFLPLYRGCKDGLRAESVEYFRKAIKRGDHAALALQYIGLLDSDIDELHSEVLDASEVEDPLVAYQACGLLLKSSCTSTDLTIRAAGKLTRAVAETNNPSYAVLAAACLAKGTLRIADTAQILDGFLSRASHEQALFVISNIGPAFAKCESLISSIRRIADCEEAPAWVRGVALLALGRSCPRDRNIQAFLIETLLRANDPQLLKFTYMGISAIGLETPRVVVERAFYQLKNGGVDERYIALQYLTSVAKTMSGSDLDRLFDQVGVETDDDNRQLLMQIFVIHGVPAMDLAFKGLTLGSPLSRALWSGVLSNIADQEPESFFQAYERHKNSQIDEYMPSLLSSAVKIASPIVEAIKGGLRSEHPFVRNNALLALTSAEGKCVAGLSPALIDIYLHADGPAASSAETILMRIGSYATPYTQEYVDINCRRSLERLQRLQRALGVTENRVKHGELLRVKSLDWIKSFVAMGELIEKQGAMSYEAAKLILMKQAKKDPSLKNRRVAASTLRRHIECLSQSLSPDSDGRSVNLVEKQTKKATRLTEEGRLWLQRCREFLATAVDTE